MSEPSDDDVEVVSQGVRVRKAFEAEEFPVPAIRFDVLSRRDEATTVRIRDEVPEDFSMDGVGFHPDYEGENWSAYQDHHVEYERTLQPDEEVTTVYGIRADSMDAVEQFLTEPAIEIVQPEGAPGSDGETTDTDRTIEDIAPPESSEVVRDVLSGDRDRVPGMDEPADGEGGGVELGGPEDGVTDAEDGPIEFGAAAGDVDESASDLPAEADGGDEDLDDLGLGDDDAEDLLGDIDLADDEQDQKPPEETAEADDDFDLDFSDSGEPSEDVEAAGLDETPGDDPLADESEPVESADDEAGIGLDEDDVDFGDVPATDDLESDDEAAEEETESPAAVEDSAPEPADGGLGLDEDVETAADDGRQAAEAEETEDETGDEPADAIVEAATETVEPDATTEEMGDAATTASEGTESAGPSPIDEWQPSSAIAEADSVAGALAMEVRQGEVPEEDLEDLKDALGVDDASSPRSVQARIEHLESRVDEFDAYTGALKEFIDEEGTGQEVIQDLDSRVEGLSSEVESLSGALDETDRTVESVDDRVGGLATDVSNLDESVEDLADDVSDIDDVVEDLDSSLEDVQDRVEDLSESVDDRLDEEVSALRSDLESIEKDLDELISWRNQLGEMFK